MLMLIGQFQLNHQMLLDMVWQRCPDHRQTSIHDEPTTMQYEVAKLPKNYTFSLRFQIKPKFSQKRPCHIFIKKKQIFKFFFDFTCINCKRRIKQQDQVLPLSTNGNSSYSDSIGGERQ